MGMIGMESEFTHTRGLTEIAFNVICRTSMDIIRIHLDPSYRDCMGVWVD